MKEREIIENYKLEDQVGFLLRRVMQRHNNIFSERIKSKLTTTQYAALVKLYEIGECSQNQLGRHTAMDAATIKGVVERLSKKGLVQTSVDQTDSRRLLVSLSEKGREMTQELIPLGKEITDEILRPITQANRNKLIDLLQKLK
ncbi:MarR family winged helix-turn-helix transcriptional regulator [Terasakiella pusilla]|uniref:MarR family winged helix-turn-helix transcriptional regulator n=1 Tax=Terasakiella pusilla TaxID=64973 RepID=UPI00048B49D9|nr:MarR family transcriptional regulator [Terasakiella pusilla]